MTDKHLNKTLIDTCLIINLNSKNGVKKNGTLNSNIIFNIPSIIPISKNIIFTEAIIESFTLPLSFYAINDYNNILNYTYNGSNFSLTITNGNYNAYTFITLLTSLFLANGHTMTIILDNSTGKLQFTSSLAFSFLSSSSSCAVIGFFTTITSSSNIINCPYPLNLLGSQKVNIYSSALNEGNFDEYGPIILSLPINQPQYSMLSYQNNSDNFFTLGNSNLANLDIQIKNEDGQYLDLLNQNFTISIKIKIHKFINNENLYLNDILS
jgi:hypothetical protein